MAEAGTMRTSSEPYFGAYVPESSLGVTAVRGGSRALLGQAIGVAVRTVSSIVLARLLMPADFGLYAIVVGVVGGLLIFKDLGLPDAMIQSTILTSRQAGSVFWINLTINIAVVVCLCVASPLLSGFFGEPRLAMMVRVWSLTIFFGALSAQHLALLKRAMLFKSLSKLSVLAAIVSNFAAIILAWLRAGYWALIFREVIYEGITTIGAWLLCGWRPQKPYRNSGIRPMLVFGGHSVASFIIRRTTRNLDRTLLGWRFGPVVTGAYHNAFELAAMLTSFIAEPLRNVAVSSLSRLREQPQVFKQQYLKALRLVAFVCFAAPAVLVAVGGDLVALFLGPKWQHSGDLLRILGLSAGISAISATNVWLHFSLGRADRMARWAVAETVLLGAGVTAGLRFGAAGVAWGYSVSMCAGCITGLWYAGRPVNLRLKEIAAVLWLQAVAAAVAGILCWYVVLETGFVQVHAARIAAFCVSFGSVYVGLAVMMSGGIKALRSSLEFVKKFLPAKLELDGRLS
jgi:PST family polysaccharide transporter